MIVLAKGLAGGFPVSALVGKEDIMNCAPKASLGGTYGGNPVACAAILAVLDVMEEENLPQKAAEMGEHMVNRLKAMADENPVIKNIRGLGSLVAMELNEGDDYEKPSSTKTAALLAAARDKGLMLLSCGVNGNVIRFLPPLTIEREILDEGLDIIAECVKALN